MGGRLSDFKKALGILSKAKQVGMFGPLHKVIGTTRSGKAIRTDFSDAQSFLKHHGGWSSQDHLDANHLHIKHQVLLGNSEQGKNTSKLYRTPEYQLHTYMANAHSSMWDSVTSSVPSIRETSRGSALQNVEWAHAKPGNWTLDDAARYRE